VNTQSPEQSHTLLPLPVFSDVCLWHNSTPLNPITAPANQLLQATFVVLIFTNQKNAVRGETVGHGRSGDSHACPVLSTV
jgi:hypothetical protein